jgi:hypothetical protein
LKIKQPRFDLDAALFTAGELAEVSGLSRAMVDVWVSRGLLEPTRRERAKRQTKGRVRKGQGRPMFSSVAIFKVRLTLELGRHLGIGLSEWVALSNIAELAKIPSYIANIAEVADMIAGGNWMWAVARGIENGKPFKICSYATQDHGEWLFDMEIGEDRRQPRFGLEVPHLFIPMWRVFETVYVECKKLLGMSDQTTVGEDV